jgi:kynurenine 3-monooxygenase
MIRSNKLSIVGSGPVGTLLAIYLYRLGCRPELFEKRADPRSSGKNEGRSINLALSHRGLRALQEIGLEESVRSIAIPMKGRMIHNEKGQLTFQPYGKEGQMIYSVSRNKLNEMLIEKAEKEHNIKIFFKTQCEEADPENSIIHLSSEGKRYQVKSDYLIGADGAFSALRKSFLKFPDFSFQQDTLSHSYKELHMPEGKDGMHAMEKNALHIWPREQFMLIALPNTDGSFTCTLFLPTTGKNSFDELKDSQKILPFFEKYFPDVISLIPDIESNYILHPASSLVTLHCYPWSYHSTLLVGDAAHAITPFYGQGMNAGFEDCRILNSILLQEKNWNKAFQQFQELRKENAEAIAELALQNFIEMRDLVADKEFLLRKKIEAIIHSKNPSYLPLYTMVTFSDIPYKEALLKGKQHDGMMQEIMELPGIEKNFEAEAGWKKIEEIMEKYKI